MRKTIVWTCLCVLLCGAIAAVAQDMHEPPKVLMIIREQVKPGKNTAHTMNEAAWSAAYKKAKYETPILALSSVTGDSEAWFLIGYESFAAAEKDGENMEKNAALRQINETYGAKEADLLNDSHNIFARYRPDLSYRPGINVAEYKYFSVTTARFRLGESVEDFFKVFNGAREKADVDTHIAIYQVVSGGMGGTFIAFTPQKSMAEWDTPPNAAFNAALKEANFSQLVGKALMNYEGRLYAFSPRMSSPSEEMIAANPEFWNPKPMMTKKAMGMEKPMPAAKKEMKK